MSYTLLRAENPVFRAVNACMGRYFLQLAGTHSPAILDWLQEEDYKTTFLCTRDESTGESRVRPLADIPHFMDVIKKTPASELLSEGWFEAVP